MVGVNPITESDLKAFRPTQELYSRFLQRVEREAKSYLTRYVIDNLTAEKFIERFAALLLRAHARAAAYGRQHAGDPRALNEGDRALAATIMKNQAEYLQRFLQDIKDGRYTDPEGIPRVRLLWNRMDLYIDRLVGTTHQAFVYADVDHLFWWRLGMAEHCEDCPRIAAASPYRGHQLPAFPGDGTTQCRTQCHCYLEREDGRVSFTRYGPQQEDDDGIG